MRQTTLDEQSTELRKLGFEFPKELVKTKYDFKTDTYVDTYAYNIGQLLNILPNVISIDDGYSLNIFFDFFNWVVSYEYAGESYYIVSDIEMVDALYKMIIKLTEEKILTPKKDDNI